ncbi:hypothetical protein GQ53DRAFT_843658 [Thozetella sp. PMI_491]|nr:hypothetical protein GQ53DRAFT_843658 [Thozetella sp. PMI_491]
MSQLPAAKDSTRLHGKPPRLRSACNQCYSAKVKCSGERDGCGRCKALRTECIYTESRVGKVPGVRSKKKNSEKEPHRVASNAPPVDGGSIDVFVDLLTRSPKSHALNTPQPDLGPWSQAWVRSEEWVSDVPGLDATLSNFSGILAGTPNDEHRLIDHHDVDPARYHTGSMGDLSPPSVADSSTRSGSIVASSVRRPPASTNRPGHPSPAHGSIPLDIGGTILPTPPSVGAGTPSTRGTKRRRQAADEPDLELDSEAESEPYLEPDLEERTSVQTSAKLDSRCVLVCTHILATLENYLLSELKTLDLILEVTRKAAAELQNLIRIQEQSCGDRCILLFGIILAQMIDLLEAGAKSVDENSADVLGSGVLASLPASFVSSMAFSAFSLSAEQRSWQSRLIRREYHHVGAILSSVIGLARRGPQGASSTAETVEQRTQYLTRLERKLKDLEEREKERGDVRGP